MVRVIDHLFFPAIIDSIFDSAPLAARVTMARVSRQWRQRAQAPFQHLLRFRALKAPFVMRIDIDCALGSFVLTTKAEFDLLSSCLVLDVHGPPFPVRWRFLRSLQAVRYRFGAGEEVTVPDVHCVILENFMPRFMVDTPGVKRLVISCADGFSAATWPDQLKNLTGLENLVIIFTVPVTSPDEDTDDDELDDDEVDDGLRLESLADLVQEARLQRVPVLIVGTEQFTTAAFDRLRLGVDRTTTPMAVLWTNRTRSR